MPNFLSKLFRRKKGPSEGGASSKKKQKGKKQKGGKDAATKDAALHDVNPASPKLQSPRNHDATRPQNSFAGVSKEREPQPRESAYAKNPDRKRVLSPRNQNPTTSPVAFTDKMSFQIVPTHDENHDHSNAASSSTSPRLSYQQLQQFERQQREADVGGPSSQPPSSQPMYTMSAELPKQQISAMDDMNRSDASSSSFNLSTDAEDSEYEQLRRRGVLPGGNASTLDTSTMSAVSSPTAYTTDDDRIFPALQTDDDMTQATAPSTKEPALAMPQGPGLLVPLQTPDDEPGRIQISPMNNESEDDLRAWTVSPSTQASKEPTSTKSAASPRMFNFHTPASGNEKLTPKGSATTPPTTTTSRSTPGAHRNFTSPKSHGSSTTEFSNDFANFADFTNFGTSNNVQPWSDEKSDPKPSPASRNFSPEFEGFNATPTSQAATPSSAPQQDSSLTDLLAQAKSKRRVSRSRSSRQSSSSVNSAPAITASYLRQQHNLRSYNGGYGDRAERDSRTSNEGTSVSDIIQSLEATNQSRMKSSSRNPTAHRSVGDTGAANTARAAKERLREKRRRDRDYSSSGLHKSRSSEVSSSDNSENEASETWLFDEVTGALGPRGIAADLESLSGRSNRSKNSQGNKSHKSHRSRSHRSSRKSSSRRPKQSSNESVDSRGSRQSRNSKNSRYSHRSTKSFISQMSEQSRSVANDLLRLEMQLAMVGSQENRDDVPARGSGSVGGASLGATSRASRTSNRKSMTSNRNQPSSTSSSSSSVARRSKVNVLAPPGKLGIILANKADSKGTVVSGVRTSSVLAEKISPGDRIVAIDGEDVSRMTVSEITTIMSRKGDYERTLTVLTTPRHLSVGSESKSNRSPSKASPEHLHHYDNGFQQFRR